MKEFSPFIIVAASDSKQKDSCGVDFVCTGKNDELTIQKAIEACVEQDKSIYLLNGTYHIDDFYDFGDGGPKAAVCFPGNFRETTVIGQTFSFGKNRPGVTFYVSKEALDKVGEGEYDVIRTKWAKWGILNGTILKLENMQIVLSHNQTPIRCIDLRRCDRVEMKNVRVLAYADTEGALGQPPAIAVKGCIGVTMTDGSNNFIVRYDNVVAHGFYEGIQVGGEHVVMVDCAAVYCYYGYTFGNYPLNNGLNHPITMINCCDERNVNLPLFNQCGDEVKGGGKRLLGGQEVTMISFNIERVEKQTPGGKLGDCMREVVPGTFCGRIEYTLQPDWNHTNEVHCQLWENDGSGKGFRTVNMTHKAVCSTADRKSYYPALGQQIFDTDLQKLLTCVDPKTKKWVDANGVDPDVLS